jgi:hypothetical protein
MIPGMPMDMIGKEAPRAGVDPRDPPGPVVA